MRLVSLSLILVFSAVQCWAHPTYTGYSGAPGRQTCASSCHGSGTGSVTVEGFPTSYTPGQSYTVTVSHTSGGIIANFNASCRFATGSTNAGLISAGTGTATYDVSGETNGVHFSPTFQNSGQFIWTAPPAGYGVVRLYVGAHQGTSASGTNNALVLVSTEAAATPGQASSPTPADNGTGVPVDVELIWQTGSGTISHDVNLGTTNPPPFVANSETNHFTPGTPLEHGTLYYWRIDERNDVGVTTGVVWSFTTASAPPGAATNPAPADGATNVALTAVLSWTAGAGATSHDLYLGTISPPDFVGTVSTTSYDPPVDLLPNTTYYWQVDERNDGGTAPGTVWSFHTETPNAAGDPQAAVPTELTLGPVYPNPFNATVTIPFALPQAAKVSIALFDVTGRQVAQMASGSFAAGTHRVQWSSEGVGSGVYLVRLSANGRTLTTKVVALK